MMAAFDCEARVKAGLAGLLALVFAGASAQAQCCPGQIYGSVTDVWGAVIPDAHVTAKCETGATLEAQTDAHGKFHTTQMPYGPCDVTIASPGFTPFHTRVVGEMDHSPEVIAKLNVYVSRGPVLEVEPAHNAAQVPVIIPADKVVELPVRGGPIDPYILIRNAAHSDWEFGAFAQGGIGLEDRTNFGFFSLGARAGHMLSGPIFSGVLQGVPEYAVEVLPVWQSYTPKFPQLKCPAGATLASQCYGPVTAGGTYRGVSITPIELRWNFTHDQRFMPWVQAAGGVVYTTRKYPGVGNLNAADATQTGPNADTSVWNFTPQGGIGVHYFTRDRRSVDAAVNAVHISSASLGDKNPGVNVSLMFSVGYTWWK